MTKEQLLATIEAYNIKIADATNMNDVLKYQMFRRLSLDRYISDIENNKNKGELCQS